MKILITGGAGFVGSALACHFKNQNPGNAITVLDNLRRRGSELNINRLQSRGIKFQHGDIRNASDLEDLRSRFDLFVECSAEPSALAGLDSSPRYVLDSNLVGTLNCLEYARQNCGLFIFLSSSRVYSLAPLKELALEETESRFELSTSQTFPGVSTKGINESFPTHLARSLYGATKLCSEYFIQEYANTYGLRAIINRCGVITGPGQFGKADQGIFTLWIARHFFGKPVRFMGFGGRGKQVRDLLHVEDLCRLIELQSSQAEKHSAEVFNVGGGREVSTSLAEYTRLCQKATGNEVPVQSLLETSSVDIPLYLSDNTKLTKTYHWKPQKAVHEIVEDTLTWIKANQRELLSVLDN